MEKKNKRRSKAAISQAKIIADFSKVRQQLLTIVDNVPVEHHGTVFLGTWSLLDLLAHLVGWDDTNLQAAREILAGQLPIVYSQWDSDWQTYNAELVRRYKIDDCDTLRANLESSHQELISFLKAIPAEDFSKDRGLRDGRFTVTVAQFIKHEIYDEQRHVRQVSAFLESVVSPTADT